MTRAERTSQRRLRRAARRAFSPVALTRFCTENDFSGFGTRVDISPGGWRSYTYKGKEHHVYQEPDWYIYQDNGASILGVAHLDSVQSDRRCLIYDSVRGKIVKSPALDDRLGAYVICDLLPRLGITVDWLLTTGEESGNSSAEHFTAPKSYNWMFSFDRAYTDVVMYEYDTHENRERVRSVNAEIGHGSFSDIAFLTHLGVAGFNWGVGYRDYHSKRAWAPLEDTFASVARFVRFYELYAGERIEHITKPSWWDSFGGAFGSAQEYEDWALESAQEGRCPACDALLIDGFCEDCQEDWTDLYDRKRYGLTEAEWREMEEREAQENVG